MFCEMRNIVFELSPKAVYSKCADSDQIARMCRLIGVNIFQLCDKSGRFYQFNVYHIYHTPFLSFEIRYLKHLIQNKNAKSVQFRILLKTLRCK